ncbi:MAG TPA: RES domain-containing protein [Rhizomicrobium sp.]|jgi:hypothetical protein|nr:RES domain-containing protein [Rhizomicrobium sp.]
MVDAIEGGEDGSGKRICAGCIAENYLHSQIARHGKIGKCDYCDRSGCRCVAIDWLGAKIDPVYRQLVRLADPIPDASGDDDKVYWTGGGSSAREVLYELIEFAVDQIGDDLLESMGGNSDPEGLDTDFYDATSDIYELGAPSDDQFHETWRSFCQSLRHEKRFFADGAARVLDQIFNPILKGGRGKFADAVRVIGPENADRFVFRGRLANDEAGRRAIYASPAKRLGPPPPANATAGRMNPAGISIFYGCSDPTTCVAELRVPVGGSAVVGKFEIIRPLRLLDLTKVEKAESGLSKFHPLYFKMADYTNFIRGFHAEIRKPVIPGSESLAYLPPQIVAEYLWSQARYPVDGVIFGSSQLSGERTNIVLFPNASIVELAADEPTREVTDIFQPSVGPDDEPIYEEHVYYQTPPNVRPQGDYPSLRESLWSWTDQVTPTALAPALRLVPDSLQRIDVQAITYETRPNAIVIREETAHQF